MSMNLKDLTLKKKEINAIQDPASGRDAAAITLLDGKVTEVHLFMSTPQQVADITTILQRAMNTWENPPAWARKLADEINGVPAPATRQEPGNG